VSAPHRPEPDTDLAPPAEKIALTADPLRRGPSGAGDTGAGASPAAPKRWQRVSTTPRP
jgi:hypothetical protein